MIEIIVFLDSALFNMTGLLFVVLGVFVLIRVANFPDLTVDGSFSIGAAAYALALASNWGTIPAVTVAMTAGALGGLLTWAINTRLGVGKVVSGVLSMIILTLSAPYLSGGTTRSLLNVDGVFRNLDMIDARVSTTLIGDEPYQMHLLFSLLWFAVGAIIIWAGIVRLRSGRGLWIRYVGGAKSPVLVPKSGRAMLLLIALCAGNALVGLGGAIEAHRRGAYTANMGVGILLVAIACMVLGESVLKSFRKREYLHLTEHFSAVLLGCFVYTVGVQCILATGIRFLDLRLLTAIFLLILLGYSGRFHSSSTELF